MTIYINKNYNLPQANRFSIKRDNMRTIGNSILIGIFLIALSSSGICGELTGRIFDGETNNLIEQMKDMTERELMEQVYVRMAIHLCGRCYKQWIENPAG